jgi:hypothetical protein
MTANLVSHVAIGSLATVAAPPSNSVTSADRRHGRGLAYRARGMREDRLGDYSSCSWRLVGGLGLEEGASSDDGGWTSVFHAQLYWTGGASAFGEPVK